MSVTVDVRSGPPLAVPAIALAVLTAGGALLGGSGPRPDSTPAAVLAYDQANPGMLGLGAALLLGSAFPLLVYAATAVRRIERLGVTAPGPLMGFAGAVLAAAALVVSALASWTAAQTAPLGDAVLARTLTWVWFGAGGVGFVAPFGLLLLGLAVPALIGRLVPRWLAGAGIAVGVLALLSTFALATDLLYPLLPVGRFGGLLVLLAFAVALPGARDAGADR
ncbi:DUF4386 domain-containing protein [Pseudonocardia sp. C8]|uniref:DUF4386 domain-containing protein n=1 Tax=Pseudonocardia sp. C8 TaxID=2762759 RepID=UPI0016426A0E|nr:DUF4386 domain-containing protein [Pseudonocardia sp. C8]MBC3192097.1 DUF4386 domain-containing protein [Pseudonocardia sp. C8]